MQNNKEKYVLITGGTSGIGLELAKLFAKDGYNLVIVARDRSDLVLSEQVIRGVSNVKIVTISKDLFQKNAAFELFETVEAGGYNIEILVNDAGQGLYGRFIETDIERELDIIQLNISSLVVLTKLFLKKMVARNEGRILNVSSVASKTPGPWQSVYHGTKAFVQSFSEAIREEVKETNVTISTLLPGATDTDFFRKAGMMNAKIVVEGDLADPADVAKDGYEALMSGKDMVVSGFKNKVQVAMGNVIPDSVQAHQMAEQQKDAE